MNRLAIRLLSTLLLAGSLLPAIAGAQATTAQCATSGVF